MRKLMLEQIDAGIARLQQQAEQVRDAEKAVVIGRIKEAVGYNGITAGELGVGGKVDKSRRPGKRRRPTVAVSAPAKAMPEPEAGTKPNGRIAYKDDAGHAGSGFGPPLQWLIAALASGKSEAELLA